MSMYAMKVQHTNTAWLNLVKEKAPDPSGAKKP